MAGGEGAALVGGRSASRDDVRVVCAAMRDSDRRDVFPLRWDDDPIGFADDLWAAADEARAFVGPDGPTAICAWRRVTPAAAQVALIATDGWPAVARAVARATRRFMRRDMPRHGLRRLEAWGRADAPALRCWLDALGFHESARLRAYGRDGEDFTVFAFLREEEGACPSTSTR